MKEAIEFLIEKKKELEQKKEHIKGQIEIINEVLKDLDKILDA